MWEADVMDGACAEQLDGRFRDPRTQVPTTGRRIPIGVPDLFADLGERVFRRAENDM